MLLKTLYSILLLITLGIEGCFGTKALYKVKYNDAPMTRAMYEYLEKVQNADHKETEEGLTKIVGQYAPLGTPIKEALDTFTSNHFKCDGPMKKKHNPASDEEYGCSFQEDIVRDISPVSYYLGFISSQLGVGIDVKQGKVVDFNVHYWLTGP